MADYDFYINTYLGTSIPADEFPRISLRADAQLNKYKRMYIVEGEKAAQDMAICAMADAIYYFENAANGGITVSSSVGGVSSSIHTGSLPDMSARGQERELYRCASMYLDFYRGLR